MSDESTDEPLLTDLYQLNMIQAYLDHGETKTAVFEFFVRKFPPRPGFLIAAGLQQVLDFLENLRFSPEEIDWLARTHRFDKGLLDRLASSRFTGDVHAMPGGRSVAHDRAHMRDEISGVEFRQSWNPQRIDAAGAFDADIVPA